MSVFLWWVDNTLASACKVGFPSFLKLKVIVLANLKIGGAKGGCERHKSRHSGKADKDVLLVGQADALGDPGHRGRGLGHHQLPAHVVLAAAAGFDEEQLGLPNQGGHVAHLVMAK